MRCKEGSKMTQVRQGPKPSRHFLNGNAAVQSSSMGFQPLPATAQGEHADHTEAGQSEGEPLVGP